MYVLVCVYWCAGTTCVAPEFLACANARHAERVGWGGCGDRLRSDHVADGNENADDDDDDDK